MDEEGFLQELEIILEALKQGFNTSSPLEAILRALIDINLFARDEMGDLIPAISPDRLDPKFMREHHEEIDWPSVRTWDFSPKTKDVILPHGWKVVRNWYTNEPTKVPDPLIYPRDQLGNPKSIKIIQKYPVLPSEELEQFFENMATVYLQILKSKGTAVPIGICTPNKTTETTGTMDRKKTSTPATKWYWNRQRVRRKAVITFSKQLKS